MQRRELYVLDEEGTTAYFCTAEDAILQKLDWYKKGGCVSERQWLDVLGVLKVQGARLDFPYLEEWAPSLGVADLLARARDEAGV
jgi:hypothetical protein